MNWLAVLISDICAALIEKLGGDISSYLKQKQTQAAAEAQNDSAAKASVQPLQNAQSGKEISDATDSALNGF